MLLHMHPSSVESGSSAHVVVTDRHGKEHMHVVDASLAKHGGPIAVGTFDLSHETNSKQHVRVSQVANALGHGHNRKTLARSGQIGLLSVDFEVQSIPNSFDFT